jgi:hypothetical protein
MHIINESYKFVVAMNKTLEPGVALNAAAHLALGLAAKASDEQKKLMSFITFKDATGIEHSYISGLSLIVLRASNGELKKIVQAVQDQGSLYTDFLQTMTGDTYKEQLEKTQRTPNSELIYYGIAVFDLKEKLDPITKKLSLWR